MSESNVAAIPRGLLRCDAGPRNQRDYFGRESCGLFRRVSRDDAD